MRVAIATLCTLLMAPAAGAQDAPPPPEEITAPAEQGAGLGSFSFDQGGEPLQIDADQGIEWRRDQRVYIARGNARAARGDLAVYASTLSAFYRDAGGGAKVYRIEANGRVRITSPSETIFGDRAVYDVGRQVLVITGSDLRAETETYLVTARDSLEYWRQQQAIVARGDATVVGDKRKLQADMLTGYFREGEAGKQKLYQVEADGNIRLSTDAEFARSQKAAYNLDKEIATLTGDVKITRGQSQLNGEYAEVNMKTGVSRLLGSRDGTGSKRVHTLLVPAGKPQKATQ